MSAERIKAAIARTGLTQADLARKLGISPQSVSGWVKDGKISKENAVELAQLAGVDVADVIGKGRFGLPVYATKIEEDGAEDARCDQTCSSARRSGAQPRMKSCRTATQVP